MKAFSLVFAVLAVLRFQTTTAVALRGVDAVSNGNHPGSATTAVGSNSIGFVNPGISEVETSESQYGSATEETNEPLSEEEAAAADVDKLQELTDEVKDTVQDLLNQQAQIRQKLFNSFG